MGFKPDFHLVTEQGDEPGLHVIRVFGELDSGTCHSVVDSVRNALRDADRVELDLGGVSFIDSAGTRALILIERTATEQGAELVIVPPPEEVTALLRTAGVTDRINLAPAAETSHGGEFVERVELEFRRDPDSPGLARAEIREALGGILDESDLASVVLLTSELVTNAVIHPGQEVQDTIGLRITTFGDGVRVEVEDAGPGFDPAAPVAGAVEGGRGLFLVDACSTRWGTRHAQTDRGRRFRVWFELALGAGEPAAVLGA